MLALPLLLAQVPNPPTVAILPFALKDGTETAEKTARETIQALFEKSKHEVVSPIKVSSAWENVLGNPAFPSHIEGGEGLPPMPTPKALLALGKKLKTDYACGGRVLWHTKSVWVGLGPKTKAEATVDILIVDVKKSEIALNATGVKSDSTKKESGIETAGALLVSFGVTALSGGPKTPHQQRAAQNAISVAMEPWLKTQVAGSKKIG